MKATQSLKQSRSLVMTQGLQQAIKLLTLTHMEVATEISKEMVENPVLEEAGDGGYEESGDRGEGVSYEGDDIDWQDYVETFRGSAQPRDVVQYDLEGRKTCDDIASCERSLAEHLQWQFGMTSSGDAEKRVAEMIIHNIDEDGFLDISFGDIVAESGETEDFCSAVRERIKGLDPVGCASEGLVECLLAQARLFDQRDLLLEEIIANYLEDVRRGDIGGIAERTGSSSEDVHFSLLLLKNLHPKPGRLISAEPTHYIAPDIYVFEVGGRFVVRVNDDGLPRLKISKTYRDMVETENDGGEETKRFVREKLRSALWLIRSINNRQKTIYRVAKAIVERQEAFFRRGVAYLKPMILRDIAEEIGVHESTVSRATTNKYMHTPLGTLELKYFFGAALGDGQTGASSEALKFKIRQLCANENPKRPLSDTKIAELLQREGIGIARRTVAKYRESLDIPAASGRKKRETSSY